MSLGSGLIIVRNDKPQIGQEPKMAGQKIVWVDDMYFCLKLW